MLGYKDYEQMELDITLDGDKELKDNIQEVVRFALAQNIQNDCPSKVMNKHEGYGIAAEYHVNLLRSNKSVDVEMKTMLALLTGTEAEFTNICGSLYNAAVNTAVAAIKLAAQSRRIIENLYDAKELTPIEEYLEENENDGFEDVSETGEPETEKEEPEGISEAEENDEEFKED